MTTCTIAAHELARLIESDRMLNHLLTHCSYLEDGGGEHDCWASGDEDRSNMPLRDYLAIRITGQHVQDTVAADPSDDICGQCNGSGEGMYDDSLCSSCHGSGVEPSSPEQEDRRDYERDARREEMEPMHYAGLLFPHQEPK